MMLTISKQLEPRGESVEIAVAVHVAHHNFVIAPSLLIGSNVIVGTWLVDIENHHGAIGLEGHEKSRAHYHCGDVESTG